MKTKYILTMIASLFIVLAAHAQQDTSVKSKSRRMKRRLRKSINEMESSA